MLWCIVDNEAIRAVVHYRCKYSPIFRFPNRALQQRAEKVNPEVMSGLAYSASCWSVPHYPWSEIGHPRYRWDSLPQEFELLVPELHADIRDHAGGRAKLRANPRATGSVV